jgi:hypothetical protein
MNVSEMMYKCAWQSECQYYGLGDLRSLASACASSGGLAHRPVSLGLHLVPPRRPPHLGVERRRQIAESIATTEVWHAAALTAHP